MVNESLQAQISSISGIVEIPEDEFTIGYIGGFCDAVLQINKIDNNSPEGMALLTVGFLAVYKNVELMQKFFKNQATSEEMQYGLQTGFNEALNWLKANSSEAKTPKLLALHIETEHLIKGDIEIDENDLSSESIKKL